MEYIHHFASPLGGITAASDGESLTGLWFEGQKYFASTLDPENEERDLPVFEETGRWLGLYFEGEIPGFTPPLKMKGSDFRRAIWEILLEIPFGQTMTYGEIAERIAKERGVSRMSAQAVGGAVGHNPVSLIIPCHRVVGADGSLTGYAGGLDKKIKLLAMERRVIKEKNMYNFYGWENALITDERGLTPRDYYDLLSSIWCAETCAPRMRGEWSTENKTLGQCSITSFLMQDIYGGKVLGVPLPDGNFHCFNVIGNCRFDLTSEQFGDEKLDYDHCPEQLREVHFKKEEKKARYEYLKEKLFERLDALKEV